MFIPCLKRIYFCSVTVSVRYVKIWLVNIEIKRKSKFKVNTQLLVSVYLNIPGLPTLYIMLHSTNVSVYKFDIFYLFVWRSTFVGSAWSFGFFSSPLQRPMTSDFEGFSIPDCIHYIYFPILILKKEPVFSLLNVQC